MEIYTPDEVIAKDNTNIFKIRVPKPIAKITLCGALTFTITDNMAFNHPTEEQIKNLKEVFNIEVELLNEDE